MADLPEDIVFFRILPRLPVKSLLRFASVSRLWRDAILHDRKFARAQLEAARHSHSHSHRRLLVSTTHYSSPPPPLQIQSLLHLAETPSFSRKVFFPKENKPLTLLGSCDGGVVFVAPFHGGEWVYIGNPSTSTWKQLPGPIYDRDDFLVGQWNIYFGAGYVAATDDYKLLVAHSFFDSHEVEKYRNVESWVEVKMFSNKLNAWKTIQAPKARASCDMTPATVVRERLHWMSSFEDERMILAFDLAREEFETMSMPESLLGNGNERYCNGTSLGVSFGGCLCVVRYPNPCSEEEADAVAADCESFFDFWVMMEYGVAESWTKLYRFGYTISGTCSDLFVLENCIVAAIFRGWSGEGASYDMMIDKTKLIRIEHKQGKPSEQEFEIVDGYYSMLEYEESLLRYDYDDSRG